MRSLLLLMLLLVPTEGPPKPKLTVSPRVTSEPATITFLLWNIPENAKVACFVLDGENYYNSCRELFGDRKSFRFEQKPVNAGDYLAGVFLDGKLVGQPQEVIVLEKGA